MNNDSFQIHVVTFWDKSRTSNREYPDIEVTPDDVEMGWYVYIGKVVAYQGAPRNGM